MFQSKSNLSTLTRIDLQANKFSGKIHYDISSQASTSSLSLLIILRCVENVHMGTSQSFTISERLLMFLKSLVGTITNSFLLYRDQALFIRLVRFAT